MASSSAPPRHECGRCLAACSAARWYPRARAAAAAASSHTAEGAPAAAATVTVPRTLVLTGAPADELAGYILGGDTRLPAPVDGVGLDPADDRKWLQEGEGEEEEDAEDGSSSSEGSPFSPSLPAAEVAIRDAIASVGGAAFVKVDGKAPADAAGWIGGVGGGPLRITNAAQLYTLLATSDAVREAAARVERGQEGRAVGGGGGGGDDGGQGGRGEDKTAPHHPELLAAHPHVVTVQGYGEARFPRAAEFRAFVAGGRVVGLCQRHAAEHFPGLASFAGDAGRKQRVWDGVAWAWERVLGPALGEGGGEGGAAARVPRTLALDVVVREGRRREQETGEDHGGHGEGGPPPLHVTLVDVSPADGTLGTLLYAWDELYGDGEGAWPCGHGGEGGEGGEG
jgi:hypothetical protein